MGLGLNPRSFTLRGSSTQCGPMPHACAGTTLTVTMLKERGGGRSDGPRQRVRCAA